MSLREWAPRKVRVACVQYQMRKVASFADFSQQVSYFVDVAADISIAISCSCRALQRTIAVTTSGRFRRERE